MNEPLEIVASNIQGQGAVQLVQSLLPALERMRRPDLIWLPDTGPLRNYKSVTSTRTISIDRKLPNAMSRAVECLTNLRHKGAADRLVLGDLPLAVHGRQVVFVHNRYVVGDNIAANPVQMLKSTVSKAIFRRNQGYIHRALVQSEIMAEQLGATYPDLASRTRIVRQPPPAWLLSTLPRRTGRTVRGDKLQLFYPAAAYDHKNHKLIYEGLSGVSDVEIELTVDPARGEVDRNPRIVRRGKLTAVEMIATYRRVDALVFPSFEESYGLPLVEALFLDLPILVADLPYARDLCREAALYFDPRNPTSLELAVQDLRSRLADGWWPDYSDLREDFPADWDAVAAEMLDAFD